MPFHHQGAVPAQLPPPSSAPPYTSPSLSDTQKGVDPSFLAALPDDLAPCNGDRGGGEDEEGGGGPSSPCSDGAGKSIKHVRMQP